MKRFKNNLPIFIVIISFLLGAFFFLYPSISNWYYERKQMTLIDKYDKQTQKMSEEELNDEFQKAQKYNKSLLENRVILTDPFDPKAYINKTQSYENTLALNEEMGYVEIPKINVYAPIYHGTSDETLTKGIGHLPNTSLPVGGKGTHCVISGHSGLLAADMFTHLNKLKINDVFYLHVLNKTLAYQVDSISVVEPEDISKLTIDENGDYVTLVTCTPYGVNTHRLLVRGTRIPYKKSKTKKVKVNETTFDKVILWITRHMLFVFSACVFLLLLLLLFILKGIKKR